MIIGLKQIHHLLGTTHDLWVLLHFVQLRKKKAALN
jgi:hypothetical protein